MNRRLLLLLLTLISLYSFGQISFEKGYLINNEDQRIDCYLKNYDWEKNPKEIEYKTGETDALLKGDLSNVKEFGISGIFKFIRVETKIDRSSKEFTDLTRQRNPIWSDEILFLKVIIEGTASLYSYKERNFERFFYAVSNNPVQQLIYKEYLVDNLTVAYNFDFRQQLWNDVRGSGITISDLEKVEYHRVELKKYFSNYNENLTVTPPVKFDDSKNREFVYLKLTPGMNYSSFSVVKVGHNPDNNYADTDFSFRIGVESGYVLPFNRNKWVFLFEPSYQSIVTKTEYMDINYKTVEFPFGISYHLFLNEKINLFLNVIYSPGIKLTFNSTIKLTSVAAGSYTQTFEPRTANCFAFGAGAYYNKLSFEFRYYTMYDLLRYESNWSTDNQRVSFIFGYRLLNIKHKSKLN